MVPTINNTTYKSDEVKEMTMGMKHNQAAGTDFMQAERFKLCGNEIKNRMPEIVNKVWEGEETSSSWNKKIICSFCRKGKKMGFIYFVGVALYCVAYYICLI